MASEPLWTRCLHLSAGTCPQVQVLAPLLEGQGRSRPELNQDRALEILALSCLTCALRPREEAP